MSARQAWVLGGKAAPFTAKLRQGPPLPAVSAAFCRTLKSPETPTIPDDASIAEHRKHAPKRWDVLWGAKSAQSPPCQNEPPGSESTSMY